jgi:hypothetical protein
MLDSSESARAVSTGSGIDSSNVTVTIEVAVWEDVFTGFTSLSQVGCGGVVFLGGPSAGL